MKENSNPSQEKMILEHLQDGYSISPIEALNDYGCFRLGARIHQLRLQGYNIKTRIAETIDVGTGRIKRFAEYFLENISQ
jgi:hypothetical protein